MISERMRKYINTKKLKRRCLASGKKTLHLNEYMNEIRMRTH